MFWANTSEADSEQFRSWQTQLIARRAVDGSLDEISFKFIETISPRNVLKIYQYKRFITVKQKLIAQIGSRLQRFLVLVGRVEGFLVLL